MASGIQARDWVTLEKPVCWVEMGRSQQYSTPSTFQVNGRQRRGNPNGPASIPLVMSRSVPSKWSRMRAKTSATESFLSGGSHSG